MEEVAVQNQNTKAVISLKRGKTERKLLMYEGKGKGKGLDICYSAAYETRTAALYNLGSGS